MIEPLRRAVAAAGRRLLAEQRGFSLIELLFAALLVGTALVSLVTIFDGSRRLTTTSEKNEIASQRVEDEMERIVALPYDSVALTSTPSNNPDPDNPDYYISSTSPPTYRWDTGSTGPRSDQVVVDAANGEVTHTTTWTDPQIRLSGTIYRYVTVVQDGCCAASDFARRVTIAVTVDGQGLRKPVVASTLIRNPA